MYFEVLSESNPLKPMMWTLTVVLSLVVSAVSHSAFSPLSSLAIIRGSFFFTRALLFPLPP